MTNYDNSAEVTVPAMCTGDPEITIRIAQCGVTDDGRARFAYLIRESGQAVMVGEDLCGPATGLWPEAADMAVTLASFLGATYECGEVTEHGREYRPSQLAWLAQHAERLGSWASEVEELRQANV